MREAGVAGDGLPGRLVNAGPIFGVPLLCGWRAGEGLADRGFGRGGGGMSDKASGETESFSESVMPAADELEALLLGSVRRACFDRGCWSSADSASSLKRAFMRGVDPVFFRCGFVMGDLPTLAFALVFAVLVFLAFLATSPAFAAGVFASRSMPSGELVVVLARLRSNIAIGSGWACNAGEVSGLKYAFGTENGCSMGKWLSKGVTAGETSGVKDICTS